MITSLTAIVRPSLSIPPQHGPERFVSAATRAGGKGAPTISFSSARTILLPSCTTPAAEAAAVVVLATANRRCRRRNRPRPRRLPHRRGGFCRTPIATREKVRVVARWSRRVGCSDHTWWLEARARWPRQSGPSWTRGGRVAPCLAANCYQVRLWFWFLFGGCTYLGRLDISSCGVLVWSVFHPVLVT